jgi:hypothetical protein
LPAKHFRHHPSPCTLVHCVLCGLDWLQTLWTRWESCLPISIHSLYRCTKSFLLSWGVLWTEFWNVNRRPICHVCVQRCGIVLRTGKGSSDVTAIFFFAVPASKQCNCHGRHTHSYRSEQDG